MWGGGGAVVVGAGILVVTFCLGGSLYRYATRALLVLAYIYISLYIPPFLLARASTRSVPTPATTTRLRGHRDKPHSNANLSPDTNHVCHPPPPPCNTSKWHYIIFFSLSLYLHFVVKIDTLGAKFMRNKILFIYSHFKYT